MFVIRRVDDSWQSLEGVFTHARRKLSRRDVLDELPDDSPKPTEKTVGRWLAHAVEHGQIKRDSAGTRSKPFRYWIEAREAILHDSPTVARTSAVVSPLNGKSAVTARR